MSNSVRKKDALVGISIPCYNEYGNVRKMAETLIDIMEKTGYRYYLFFIDNCSTDGTEGILRELAKEHKQIKGIMNRRNYGVIDGRSFENAEKYKPKADVYISIACDFQEPPELIPEFLKYWEEGYDFVCGQKTSSKEGKIKYAFRCLYYKIIQGFSEVSQYNNMSGILLIDAEAGKSLAGADRDCDFRYKLADTGYEVKLIQYEQNKRVSGKSSYNIFSYLTFAITSMVNVSTKPLRMITVFGFLMSAISFVAAIVYFILKLILWYNFPVGIAPIIIGMLFIGSVQMFSLGVIGEYIGILVKKQTHMPEVSIKETFNLDE